MHNALFGFFIPPTWYARVSKFFRALGKRLTFLHKGFRTSFDALPVRLIFRGVNNTTLKQGEKRYIDIEASKALETGCAATWSLYNAAGSPLLTDQPAEVDAANRLVSALLDTASYSPGNYTVAFRVTNGQEIIIHCESVIIQA